MTTILNNKLYKGFVTVKLTDIEAQNPKVTSDQGAILALLVSIALDQQNTKGTKGPKSDSMLSALVDDFVPHDSWHQRRSSLGEKDRKEILTTNRQESNDDDFHPKYIDCPIYKATSGVILTKEAFYSFLKENQEFQTHFQEQLQSNKAFDIQSLISLFESAIMPSNIIKTTLRKIEELEPSIPTTDIYYLVTLLNGTQSHSIHATKLDDIIITVKQLWMKHFQLMDRLKLSVLPLDYLAPMVSIQLVPIHDVTDNSNVINGVFKRLNTDDDPRVFLLQYNETTPCDLIANKANLKSFNKCIVTRSYDYSSFTLVHESMNNQAIKISEKHITQIARLCSTLEKMMGVELRIIFQLVNDDVQIIFAENLTQNTLTKWEIQNEFTSAEMSLYFREAAREYTPLTLSSIVSQMSQSQQLIFNGVDTEQLYMIGKIVRKFRVNTSTSSTIQRLLGMNGEAALKHIASNFFNYKYQTKPVRKFLENAEITLNKKVLSSNDSNEKLLASINFTLRSSQILWNSYYNLVALHRSWLYVIFKFICGTSDGMKAQHYEDFSIILRYFNVRDLSIQKITQACKRAGDDFLNVSMEEMKDEEIVDLFKEIVEGNPALQKSNTLELLPDDMESLNWRKQLQFAFNSYTKIKSYDLNSTFNLRFPEEKKRTEHVLNNMCSVRTRLELGLMKLFLTSLRKVTKELVEVNIMRERFIDLIKGAYSNLSYRLRTQDIYCMTERELQLFIKKQRFEFMERAVERYAYFSENQTDKSSETDVKKYFKGGRLFGECIIPGKAVGKAIVIDCPTQDIISPKMDSLILITKNLRKDISWLPYMRLFKGIVLEADGYLDSDAAICRLIGVPCIIGAKGATKSFKTGNSVVLNATKGVLMKQVFI